MPTETIIPFAAYEELKALGADVEVRYVLIQPDVVIETVEEMPKKKQRTRVSTDLVVLIEGYESKLDQLGTRNSAVLNTMLPFLRDPVRQYKSGELAKLVALRCHLNLNISQCSSAIGELMRGDDKVLRIYKIGENDDSSSSPGIQQGLI
jgi:hypothetical protein